MLALSAVFNSVKTRVNPVIVFVVIQHEIYKSIKKVLKHHVNIYVIIALTFTILP